MLIVDMTNLRADWMPDAAALPIFWFKSAAVSLTVSVRVLREMGVEVKVRAWRKRVWRIMDMVNVIVGDVFCD
jgi:hypothetical protein